MAKSPGGSKYFNIMNEKVLAQMDPAFREALPFRCTGRTLVDKSIIDLATRLRLGGVGLALLASGLQYISMQRYLRRRKAFNCGLKRWLSPMPGDAQANQRFAADCECHARARNHSSSSTR